MVGVTARTPIANEWAPSLMERTLLYDEDAYWLIGMTITSLDVVVTPGGG